MSKLDAEILRRQHELGRLPERASIAGKERKTRLSETAEAIAEVIGRERTLYLIGKLPRCYPPSRGRAEVTLLYVPKRLRPKSWLVEILGWNDAEKLVRVFGGELLKPGNCHALYRAHRDAGIIRAAQDGVPHAMISEWFEVSARHVQNVLRENVQVETRTTTAQPHAQTEG